MSGKVSSRGAFIIKLTCSFSIALFITQPGCKGDLSAPPTVGPEWRTFTTSNTLLRNNTIRGIASDPNGIVWIATDFGGYSYSLIAHSWGDLTESLYTRIYFPEVTNMRNVTSVTYAKDKAVWFGFSSGELIRYNPFATIRKLVWTRYKDPSVYGSKINSLDAMRSEWSPFGEVWAATSTGIKRFIQEDGDGKGDWMSYTVRGYSDGHVLCARTNSFNGTVWFGIEWDEVVIQAQYDPRFQFSPLTLPTGSHTSVNSIAFDADTTVWIAQNQSVQQYSISGRRWNSFNYQNTGGLFPAAKVFAVESKKANLHWFGTDSGLVRLADASWSRFTTANSPLPDNHVTFLRYDVFGNLWIGTKGGIAVYNPSGTRL